jgi:hypothetical protein
MDGGEEDVEGAADEEHCLGMGDAQNLCGWG